MDIREYQKLVLTTAPPLSLNDLVINGAMGLNGEAGEVIDIVKKWMYQGHNLNEAKLMDELGDVLWYVAILAHGLEVSIESLLEANIEKLKARYPDGFDAERSINREG